LPAKSYFSFELECALFGQWYRWHVLSGCANFFIFAAPLAMTDRMRPKAVAKPSRSTPARVSPALFGRPAVIRGEDQMAYEALRARVRHAIEPIDFLDELLVESVVARTYQIDCWRRFDAALLKSTLHEALETVLAPLRDVGPEDDLISRWARGEAAARAEVDRILAGAGLNMDTVRAVGFAQNIALFQALEHMIGAAELSRERSLREIERRRLNLGRDLRRIVSGESESGDSAT
jgi:hypothetical protein